MSMESAKAFIERMNTDAEFAKRAMELRGKEQIAAFVAQEGFDFSEEEYRRCDLVLEGEELSDENLDKVVGGRSCFGCTTSIFKKIIYS